MYVALLIELWYIALSEDLHEVHFWALQIVMYVCSY